MEELCKKKIFPSKGRSLKGGQISTVLRRLEASGMVVRFKKDKKYHVKLSDKALKWLRSRGVHSFYDIKPREKKFRKFRQFGGLER